MDLLIKNPSYFFDTYFNIPVWKFVFCWVIAYCMLFFFVLRDNGEKKSQSIPWCLGFAFMIATIISTTILNKNRINYETKLVMNPIPELIRAFRGNPHALRQILSNCVLFIPFGFILSVKKKMFSSIVCGLILSAVIEGLQYLLHRGTCELLDVLMNTMGTFVGVLLYTVYRKVYAGIREIES